MSTPLKYLILTHFKLADNFCPFFKKLQKSKKWRKIFKNSPKNHQKSPKIALFWPIFSPKLASFRAKSDQSLPKPHSSLLVAPTSDPVNALTRIALLLDYLFRQLDFLDFTPQIVRSLIWTKNPPKSIKIGPNRSKISFKPVPASQNGQKPPKSTKNRTFCPFLHFYCYIW